MVAPLESLRRLLDAVLHQEANPLGQHHLSADLDVFAGAAQFGLFWLDPLAALVVGLIILKTSYEIFRDAAHALTDGFDEMHLERIGDLVLDTPGVKSIIDLKARSYGSNVYVDLVIGVNPSLTVGESHDITVQIEKRLFEREQIEYVHIHVEPEP